MTYNLMLDRKATRCLSLLLVGDALDGGCGLRVSNAALQASHVPKDKKGQ